VTYTAVFREVLNQVTDEEFAAAIILGGKNVLSVNAGYFINVPE